MSSNDKVRLFPISTTLAAPSWAIRQAIMQRKRNLLFILAISKALEENSALFYELQAEKRQNGEAVQYFENSKSVSPSAANTRWVPAVTQQQPANISGNGIVKILSLNITQKQRR